MRFLLLIGLLLLPIGCAKHSDFVDMRQELDQAHKRQEALQRRLQSVEGKLGVKPAHGDESQKLGDDLQHLTARLRELENRLARLESGQSSALPPGKSERAEEFQGSKPRPSDSQEMTPMITGTPPITPTSAFNLAYNDYLNGRYDLAVTGFQRFLKDFSATSLAPVAQYWLGEAYFSKKEYPKAIQAFERVVTDFPHSEKVPAALYKLGLATAEAGDSAKARGYLKKVIQDYSTSDEAKLAKNKLADIR